MVNNTRVSLLILFLFIFLSCSNKLEKQTEMTVEKWKDDIETLFSTLESKHINLYHSITENEVKHEVDSLLIALPVLSDGEIFISISKIIRSLDDSHTGIWAQSKFYDTYPLEFFVFSDSEIRVLRAPLNHPELMGAQLLSIDKIPLHEIIKEVLLIIQCADNWYSESDRLARYMKYSKVLKILGITKKEESANFTFLLENRAQKTVKLKSISNTDYSTSLGNPKAIKSPFHFDKSVIGTPYLWYQPIDELKTGYIYFAGYPNTLQMRRFAIAVSRDIIQRGTKKIIIDVRNNGGGDFYVGLELVKLLSITDQIDWKNGVYVITGRKTYSAEMSNTAHFKELLNAKIIGEPTGANPNNYQDAEMFQLKNSKLRVQFSKRYYRFQDTISNGIIPDVHIKPNWKTLNNKIDANIKWILDDIKQNEDNKS